MLTVIRPRRSSSTPVLPRSPLHRRSASKRTLRSNRRRSSLRCYRASAYQTFDPFRTNFSCGRRRNFMTFSFVLLYSLPKEFKQSGGHIPERGESTRLPSGDEVYFYLLGGNFDFQIGSPPARFTYFPYLRGCVTYCVVQEIGEVIPCDLFLYASHCGSFVSNNAFLQRNA